MRFPYREIHGFEDAQGNFEALEARAILDSAWEQFGGRGSFVGAGAGTVNVTQPHGMGRVPNGGGAFLMPGPAITQGGAIHLALPDATNFFFQFYGNGANVFAAGQTYGYCWFGWG